MSAIGPGDWVQCVRRSTARVTVGAVYQVRHLTPRAVCITCGDDGPGLSFFGNPGNFCPQAFRLWPPPADEALRCEPVDADEPVSVPA